MEDVQKSSTFEGVVDGRTWCDKKKWIGIECIQQNVKMYVGVAVDACPK